MRNEPYYEWDIETVDLETGLLHSDEADIINHDHSDKCPSIPTENDQRLVLVRDSTRDGRAWAYVDENGKLKHFCDAYGNFVCKVPKRYRKEFNHALLGDRDAT